MFGAELPPDIVDGQMRVLVVDADELALRTLRASVPDTSWVMAGSAAEAFPKLDEWVDVVVTELAVPSTDDAVRLIEHAGRYLRPTIVLASAASDADRKRVMEAGAVEVLIKSGETYALLPERLFDLGGRRRIVDMVLCLVETIAALSGSLPVQDADVPPLDERQILERMLRAVKEADVKPAHSVDDIARLLRDIPGRALGIVAEFLVERIGSEQAAATVVGMSLADFRAVRRGESYLSK